MKWIPPEAQEIVEYYLNLVDEVAPGRIEGLFLVGSIALDDFHTSGSDIDFIAVSPHRLGADDLDRLEAVHGSLCVAYPRPWFSGCYVTWRDLALDPRGIPEVPFCLEGVFQRTGGFDANPAVWRTLRCYPVAVRGPTEPAVWDDPEALKTWTLENLHSYWRDQVSRGRAALQADRAIPPEVAIPWCVPGVARMHYTIATGDVLSKSAACRYALGAFPRCWHRLIGDALALRQGEMIEARDARGLLTETFDFMEFVIDSAGTLGTTVE